MKNDHLITFSIHNLVFTYYLPAASIAAANYFHLVPGCLSPLPVPEAPPTSLLPDHTVACSPPETAGLAQTHDLTVEANSAHFDPSELGLTPAAAQLGQQDLGERRSKKRQH